MEMLLFFLIFQRSPEKLKPREGIGGHTLRETQDVSHHVSHHSNGRSEADTGTDSNFCTFGKLVDNFLSVLNTTKSATPAPVVGQVCAVDQGEHLQV